MIRDMIVYIKVNIKENYDKKDLKMLAENIKEELICGLTDIDLYVEPLDLTMTSGKLEKDKAYREFYFGKRRGCRVAAPSFYVSSFVSSFSK